MAKFAYEPRKKAPRKRQLNQELHWEGIQKDSIEFDQDKEKFLEQELQHQEEEDKACNFQQC